MTFDPLRTGRTNRDRRDASYDNAVAKAAIRLELDRCILCNEPLPAKAEHYPYCSARCSLDAELDV